MRAVLGLVAAHHDEVIGVARHLESTLLHQLVERVQVHVCQLGPGAAPARARHLLGAEQRATTPGVRSLALVEGAVVALLVIAVLGKLLAIGLGRVGHIAQRDGLGVLLVDLGLGMRPGGGEQRKPGSNKQCKDTYLSLLTLLTPQYTGKQM